MNGYIPQRKEFDNYNYFNAGEKTNPQLYKEKFIASISNLDSVYGYYVNKYRELPLPPSLSKRQIVMKEAENNPDYVPDIKLNRKKPAIQKDNKHKKTGKGKVHKSK